MRRRAPARAPGCASPYAAGHFTALIRRYDWPPSFVPQAPRTRELEMSEISRANRERRVAMGDTGTMLGVSRRADERIALRTIGQQARL